MIDYNLDEFLNEKYINKEEIKFRIPIGNDIELVWDEILQLRKKHSISLKLNNKTNEKFWFNETKKIKDNILQIDKLAKDGISNIIPSKIKFDVINDLLIEEAFYSSIIEGAFSTRQRAKEMIKTQKQPKDKSEKMILNNYNALSYILENLHKPIDENILISIWKIITEDTLEDEDKTKKYRNNVVYVTNNKGEIVYTGPDANQVDNLMDDLFSFINEEHELHDVIKSCIIHFYFVYVHPFFDGNGRTGRGLSYLYLLKKEYEFFKFFSISMILHEKRNKYYKAIKDCEDYGNDITYFIEFYTSLILEAIINIRVKYMHEHGRQLIYDSLNKKGIVLKLRQKNLISNLIKKKTSFITLENYKKNNNIVYETGRKDLYQLVELGIIRKEKIGKKYVFTLEKNEEIVNKMLGIDRNKEIHQNEKRIYISYAMEDEKIAEEIEKDFEAAGVNIDRNIKYRDTLRKYINTTKSNYTIIILSHNYFKSFNCIQDILELMNEGNYKNRITTIKAKGFELSLDEIVKYWNDALIRLDGKRRSITDPIDKSDLFKEIAIIKEVINKVPIFINQVKRKSLLEISDLKKRGYKELLDDIELKSDITKDLLVASNISDETQLELFLDELLIKYRENSKLFFLKGTLAERREDYKKAKVYFEKTIKIDPGFLKAYLKLSNISYQYMNNYEEAKKYLYDASKINTDDAFEYYELVKMLKEKFKDYNKAIEVLKNAIEKNPKLLVLYIELGHILESDSIKNYEEARKYYEKAISIDENYFLAYGMLGNLLGNQYFKQYDKAKQYFEKAIQLNIKDAFVYVGYAELLANDYFKDYQQSKKLFKKAIEINPNYVYAYTELSELLINYFGEYDAAKKYYEKAIEANKNYKHAYTGLSKLLIDYFNDFNSAKKLLEKIIRIDSNYEYAYTMLAELIINHFDEYEKAKEYLEKAISIDNKNVYAYILLKDLLINHLNDPEEAKKCFEKIKELTHEKKKPF